ncbi:dihydroorotate dehydrogenase [Terrihabitans soli]|uniref:Dihydroorotate dehydrogenase n=1 Tax=Terrihabitans soli TaxID=708113 RepID=A0A6S6QW45_9HYPH|nr:divalent-cation tolerance protein CutA [Terrihabitans soli]BCJ91271.1 dihydroorotate dehydrogenase [Terrihabitans soli]
MQETVLVYTTWPSVEQAENAGRRLVEQKLCACVNILPGMVSVYAFEGKIERGEEAVMILKTARDRSADLMQAVRAAHPYDTPAIIELPVSAIDPRYGAWILSESRA